MRAFAGIYGVYDGSTHRNGVTLAIGALLLAAAVLGGFIASAVVSALSAYLRTVRLQQVHAQLRAAAREGRAVPLYEMAYRYGFFHLGRFSAYYKAQFGEPPSATLKRR